MLETLTDQWPYVPSRGQYSPEMMASRKTWGGRKTPIKQINNKKELKIVYLKANHNDLFCRQPKLGVYQDNSV